MLFPPYKQPFPLNISLAMVRLSQIPIPTAMLAPPTMFNGLRHQDASQKRRPNIGFSAIQSLPPSPSPVEPTKEKNC